MKRFKNISKIVRHFILNKNLLINLKQHRALLKVLKPFKDAGLISNRTSAIYLFSYIARFLSTSQKLAALSFNYSFLTKKFDDDKLKQMFNEGITCFEEKSEEDTYKVLLKSSHIFEFEGSQFLVFTMNDQVLFTLSFTFVPANLFGISAESLIYVSALKGTKNEFEKFSKATKYFRENIPSVILIKVLEAIGQTLDISTIAGISAENQLSFAPGYNDQNFLSNYDEFWKNLGASETNGNYEIALPMAYKDILLIKQKYRNRTIKKRKVMDDILSSSMELFSRQVIAPSICKPASREPGVPEIAQVTQIKKPDVQSKPAAAPQIRVLMSQEYSGDLHANSVLAH